MEGIVKHINDTNASFRTIGAGNAKNTDLFLDNEHYEYFRDAGEQITVRLNKENLQKAILFIASILPRKYDNSGIHKTEQFSTEFVFDQLAILDAFFTIDGVKVDARTQKWNARKDVVKKNGDIDNRFYFNGLLEDVPYINSKGEQKTAKFTIRNYFAGGYSEIHIKKSDDGIFDVWVTNTCEFKEDGKELPYEELQNYPPDHPLQQIFYGAPGTGKSHTINEITEKQPKENVFRTTFHPDSDYATFVGCYKPTKEATSILSLHKLHELYPEFKTKVENRPLHRFITKYYNSFRLLTEKEAESVFDKIETSSTVTAEVPKIMAAIEEIPTTSSISYSFVPQTFTKAYLRAWQTEEPVFLVIEEINRGNCAQIFGDLFQLLDRKNGFSEYPIKADNDLAAYIGEQLSKESREGIPETVKSGEELILPPNLFIWATMNTSDQSLFPIDSAFKRRWEWKYIKIAWPYKKNEDGTFKTNGNGDGIHFNYSIEGGHDWWAFLQQINAIIDKMTNSADKQLGYFFAKAKDDVISYDTFVSKVCFYLWNDIFKTYALDEQQGDLFIYTDNEGKKKQLTFPAFYDGDGNVIKEVAEAFIGNVMSWGTDTKNDKE